MTLIIDDMKTVWNCVNWPYVIFEFYACMKATIIAKTAAAVHTLLIHLTEVLVYEKTITKQQTFRLLALFVYRVFLQLIHYQWYIINIYYMGVLLHRIEVKEKKTSVNTFKWKFVESNCYTHSELTEDLNNSCDFRSKLNWSKSNKSRQKNVKKKN